MKKREKTWTLKEIQESWINMQLADLKKERDDLRREMETMQEPLKSTQVVPQGALTRDSLADQLCSEWLRTEIRHLMNGVSERDKVISLAIKRLKTIQARCGAPNAVEACRNIHRSAGHLIDLLKLFSV